MLPTHHQQTGLQECQTSGTARAIFVLGFHPTAGNLLMEGNWAALEMELPGPI